MAERIVWTAPDGQTIELTDESAGYRVLANGTRGLRSVAYSVTATQYAGMDGADLEAIRVEPNELTIGVRVWADGAAELRAKVRQLVRTMRPRAGLGRLTVSDETGRARHLQCYCIGGLEGDESTDSTLPGLWRRMALKFYAPDPWWYGDTQTLSVGLGPPTPFFPFFPLVLSASTVQGEFIIDLSDTDAPTPPVWTIVGPGAALILTNQTTGQVIEVNASIPAGDTMVIDTRPGHQSVRRGDGTNLMSAVASDPALWTLIEDVNRVTAVLSGATSDSRIQGSYRPRYAGA